MRLQGFFISLSFLCTSLWANPLEQVAPEKIAQIAQSRKWKKLLHYQKSLLGFERAQADGKSFYLSPEGRANPESELRATLKVLIENPKPLKPDDEPLICHFPSRRRFLEKEIPELASFFQKDPCLKFQAFKNSIQAVGASMVFSSYFLNNPSSAFGHTFLRFHRSSQSLGSQRAELLDMGVNYAAVAFTNNALLYGIYGLTGVFEGHFSKLPYYYKVREYADFESRDLWTYELNLTQEQVDEMVEHLWDLGHTYFDYYFLGENCSYHLMSLLDVVLPESNLMQGLSFYVIPSETIKVLMKEPGLVKSIHFRPSNRKVFEASLADLNEQQRKEFFKLVAEENPDLLDSQLSDASKIKILDAIMDYVDFRFAKEIVAQEAAPTALKQKFLLARAKIPLPTETRNYPLPQAEIPHEGHEVKKIALSAGHSTRSDAFLDARFRFAFHNKLDRLKGYPEHTTMEVFETHLRGESKFKKISLRDFSFARIESYSPIDEYSFPPSFTIKFGAERVMEKDHCKRNRDCLAGMFRVGGGMSLNLPLKFKLHALGLSEFSLSPALARGWARWGVGPNIGIYRPFYKYWSWGANYKSLYYPWFENSWAQSFGTEFRLGFSKNLDFFFKADRNEMAKEVSAGLQYLF